jgi:hypothetical protein
VACCEHCNELPGPQNAGNFVLLKKFQLLENGYIRLVGFVGWLVLLVGWLVSANRADVQKSQTS